MNLEADILAKYFLNRSSSEELPYLPQVGFRRSSANDHYAVVVSQFNSFITDRLLNGALETLKAHQVPSENIKVVSVPGAFEIPITAKLLARSARFDAIVCLGCLIRGNTLHYELIAHETSRGIGQSALETGIPHTFGLITCDTQDQAIDRAGLKSGNIGSDAAVAAVKMVAVKNELTIESVTPALV